MFCLNNLNQDHHEVMIKVQIPGLHLKSTKSETLILKLWNVKIGQAPWMILNFKNPLGKGMERILKVSRRNLHLKMCFFLYIWIIYRRHDFFLSFIYFLYSRLSVLYISVYICQSQSPSSSHHHHTPTPPLPAFPPWCPYVCSLHPCLHPWKALFLISEFRSLFF